jgi:release factor glutamine methyltransferase
VTGNIPPAAIAEAIGRLRAAGCVFAEDEAAVLQEAAADEGALWELVRRRADGEPLEQVVGYADFCGVRVRLRPGVFVPRIRSQLLVRRAVIAATRGRDGRPGTLDGRGARVVLDLCCGSGALGVAVRQQVAEVDLYAADLAPVAVQCARDNLGVPERVFQGDLFQPLPAALRGRVDVLLANVPYVATRHIALLPAEARLHEPRTALDGGADGLDVLRAVIAEAPAWLAPGGVVLAEITEAQAGAATAAVRAAGLRAEVTHDQDLEATVIEGHR